MYNQPSSTSNNRLNGLSNQGRMSDSWRRARFLELHSSRTAAANAAASSAAAGSSSNAEQDVSSSTQEPTVYEVSDSDERSDPPQEERGHYEITEVYEIPSSELSAGEEIPASDEVITLTCNDDEVSLATEFVEADPAYLRSRHVVVPEAPRYVPGDVDMESQSRSHVSRWSSFAEVSNLGASTSGQNKRKGKDPTGLMHKRSRKLQSPERVPRSLDIYNPSDEVYDPSLEQYNRSQGRPERPSVSLEHNYGSERYERPERMRVFSSNVGVPPPMPAQSAYVEPYPMARPVIATVMSPQPGSSTSRPSAPKRGPRLVTSTATCEKGNCRVLMRCVGDNDMEVQPSMYMEVTGLRPEGLQPIVPDPTHQFVSADSTVYQREDVESSLEVNHNSTYDVHPCHMCRGISINCCRRRYPRESSAGHMPGRLQTMQNIEFERASMSSDDSYGLVMAGEMSSDTSSERAEAMARARQDMATRQGNSMSTENYIEPIDYSTTGHFNTPGDDKMNEDQSE